MNTRDGDSSLALTPPPVGRREFRNIGLVFSRRIGIGWSATAVLQERDATQAGFALRLIVGAIGSSVVLPIAGAVAIGLGWLLRLAWLLRITLLAFLTALAPALIIAMGEATHGLDHPEIMVGVLPVRFRHDPIARRRRFAGQRLVFVEHLVGVAADPYVGAAAIEDLVSVRRAVGIVAVMLLMMAMAAATTTTATAARPLTIVWSHLT